MVWRGDFSVCRKIPLKSGNFRQVFTFFRVLGSEKIVYTHFDLFWNSTFVWICGEKHGPCCENVLMTSSMLRKCPDDRSMLRKCPDNSIIEKTFIEKKYEEISVRVFLEYAENEEGKL